MDLSALPSMIDPKLFGSINNLKPQAVNREIKSGRLPCVKVGRLNRIRIEDAVAWRNALPRREVKAQRNEGVAA